MPEIVTAQSTLLIVAALAYLLGSVPFGVVIARVFGLGDLRAIGSGNIGATNVLRTGNKLAAVLTLVLDAGKGAIAVLTARALVGEDAAQLAGLAAFVGHCWPIFLRFKGGKGVATFLGTLLALNPVLGILSCLLWLLTAFVTRISSLAALIAAGTAPVISFLLGYFDLLLLSSALAFIIHLRHRDNIARIRKGTESKIGQKG